MKLPSRVIAQLGILFVVLALASSAAQEPAPKYSRIQTDVSVKRSSKSSYTFSAKVVDLATGEVVAVRTLDVPVGKEVKAEPVTAGLGKARLSFSGEVDSMFHNASYTFRLEQNGKLVSDHSAYLSMD